MPSWPTAVRPCGPSGFASPHSRLRGGAGGPVLFSAVPPPGALSLAPYPGSAPRPLLTARPPPSWGGAGPAVLLPALLRWACGGSSGLLCVWPVMLFASCLVVVWGRSPGLLNPILTAGAFPLARAQGWVYPCVLMHVSCARLSPFRWTWVSGCVHGCVCQSSHRPSLFRGVRKRWKTFSFFMGPHVWWPASVSASRTVVCLTRFLSVGFLFDELVPSHCRIPCQSGAAYCRPTAVGFLACSPQSLRWAFV
jgi:hypothetical protein